MEQAGQPSVQTSLPPAISPAPGTLKPHRGTLVLVLGILGLVICVICGVIAWVMGNKDLREMDEGVMDPSGRSLTQAGRVCGMISSILAIAGVVIWLIVAVLAVAL